MDCFGTYITHAKAVITFRVQNASGRIAQFSRFCVFVFSRFRVFPFSRFRVFAFSRFRVFLFSQVESSRFSRFRVFAFSSSAAASPRPGHRVRVHSLYQGLRICCEALFWEICIAPFPTQKVYCFQNILPGCGILRTLLPLRFQGVFGVLPRICISEVPWWRPAEMSFVFFWRINHLWWSFHFLWLFRWRIMNFWWECWVSKEGPENLTWNFPFHPISQKGAWTESICPLMKLGLVPQSIFVTKRSQEEQLNPPKGLFSI